LSGVRAETGPARSKAGCRWRRWAVKPAQAPSMHTLVRVTICSIGNTHLLLRRPDVERYHSPGTVECSNQCRVIIQPQIPSKPNYDYVELRHAEEQATVKSGLRPGPRSHSSHALMRFAVSMRNKLQSQVVSVGDGAGFTHNARYPCCQNPSCRLSWQPHSTASFCLLSPS
jgi:hypothetical protein